MNGFVILDETGCVTQRGQRPDGYALPEGAVPIPDLGYEVWYGLRWTGEEWIERELGKEPVSDPEALALIDLADARARAFEQVTAMFAAARRLFITDLPGQEMLYLEKRTQATAYLAA